jgi:hypothetical protein
MTFVTTSICFFFGFAVTFTILKPYPMKKHILILGFSLFVLHLNGQVYKTIHVTTPGTLDGLLTSEEKATVTDFTVTGTIDSTDFITMRDHMPELRLLDLSGASAVNNALYELALSDKDLLHTILLPHSITRIGQEALMNCSIEEIIIPPTVTLIEHAAFRYCPLKLITLPASVKKIEWTVFAQCDSLKAIYVEEGNTAYCSVDGVLFNSDTTVLVTCPPCKKGSYSIPSSVTEIDYEGFAGCQYIESLFIPASVTKIGEIAFYGCSLLTGFQVEATSEFYCALDGVLFSKDKTILVQYPLNRPYSSYIVPHGTTKLGYDSFNGCRKLESISFPATLTEIDASVFRYCYGLTTLELPPSLKTIGMYAFGSCRYLQNIRIPSSLDNVGKCILCGAEELDTITVNSSVPIELSAMYSYFNGVDTNTCVLMVPSGSADAYGSSLHWKLFDHITEYDTYLEVSETEFNIEAAGGSTAIFTINSNTEWRLKSDAIWIQISDTLGMNDKTITISADPNTGSGDRQSVIDLTPLEKETISLYVTQAGTVTNISQRSDKEIVMHYNALQKCIVTRGLLNYTLSVFTIDGRLIMSQPVHEDAEMIFIGNLPEGIYIVKAGTGTLKIPIMN